MKIEAIPAKMLTADQTATWSALQRVDPSLNSPYFRPEFTQAVAAVRDDVEVGLFQDDGELVGFFPFQRRPGNVAVPVGGKMSDFQGLIMRKGVFWDPRKLLRGCRLSAWQFDHLITTQEPLRPYHWTTAGSPYIDLSQGWDAYLVAQKIGHKKTIKKIFQKFRRCERIVGPVRLEFDTADPKVFDTMVAWKRQQYHRTGVADVLEFDWTNGLLKQVLAQQSEDFAGVLSALYLGDKLSAVLLSMRSGDVLHTWFSAHDQDPLNISPGLLMWIEIIRVSAMAGIRRIDLGKGGEAYKTHLMSGAIELAEGAACRHAWSGICQRYWHQTVEWARQSPLRKPLLKPARMLRRMADARRLE